MRRAVMTMTSSAERFRASAALLVAAALAVGLLLLVDPAGAAFPGFNSSIAFESSRDGNFEIYAMNEVGGGQTNFTNHSGNDYQPAYSPDGQNVAFYSDRDGSWEIYVMNKDGTGQTRLTNNGKDDWNPAFSADGDKIAFVSNRDGADFEIFVMNATDNNNDGNGDNLKRLTDNSADDIHPVFSPDGQKIAFSSDRDGDSEVFVMTVNGSGQTNLTKNAVSDSQPAYSPNGQKIVFSSDRDDPLGEVYVMDKDGSKPIRLTNDPESDSDPAFSPDGSKIAFVSFRSGFPNAEIYVVNADGSGTPTNLTNNSARDLAPDWQPVCTINGTTGDDVFINGSPNNDVICGLGGNDEINAAGGNDVVVGGEGNDTIKGGSGRDRVFGGFGDDILNVKDGVRRNDVVDGGEGTDACKRDRGDKRLNCP